MNSTSLTQEIKNEAKRLGFQVAGVTRPTRPSHFNTYTVWLEKKHHATMTWLDTERARECRADPSKILPDCKSILVLGIRYPAPIPHQSKVDANARIASYALGEDYHVILPMRLKEIVSFIQERTGQEFPNRWYTDTGPILEKELAQQAGLGWIGKNTCLINPKMGSYFLLAEIFLGIELNIDKPLSTDFCGSCRRCIEQCPTGCITPERTIDSNRCISYLTIEHKGFIPEDLRAKIGNWVFGCDICQIVCPWNQKFADPEFDQAFTPRPAIRSQDLQGELALTPEQFNRKFKGSPVKRVKRRGYLRNIAIVLGNRDDHSAIPSLCQALQDPEPLVRGHAAWALGQLGGEKSRRALDQAGKKEDHPIVLIEIKMAMDRV